MLEMFASFLGMGAFILFILSGLAAWGKVNIPENNFDFLGYTVTYEFTKTTPYSVSFEKLSLKG